MNIKVTGPNKVTKTDKTKKTNKPSSADASAFTSMVESAQAVESVEERKHFTGGSQQTYIPESSPSVPEDTNGRLEFLLDQLQELEKDILSGNETRALERIKEALKTTAKDKDDMPAQVKELVDEVEARAEIEVAKMEAAKK